MPKGVQIFVDGEDITYYLSGVRKFNPTPSSDGWNDVDITGFVTRPGHHIVKVTCEDGAGRVDVKIKMR